MFRWTASNVVWSIAYLLTMAMVVFGMRHYRESAMKTYGTDQANANWQEWRAAATDLADKGPVDRKPPRSVEPPPLVLMRDHFAACLGISLLLSSCLFAWMMICVRGVTRPVVLHEETDGVGTRNGD
jgi:hypothetical protein